MEEIQEELQPVETETVRVYLDSDFRCHAEDGEGRTPFDTDFFVGREELIPSYRAVPAGAIWVRPDGQRFGGEMIAPAVPIE